MKRRHYTIPVFIPMEACPFHCIYCDQKKIAGHCNSPSPEDVRQIIIRHLETIPKENVEIHAGFFGGTFTGLRPNDQAAYLSVVQPFIDSGRVHAIRLSTRPDFISPEIISLLKKYHVDTIELGAQSLDDEVLRLSGRGHTASDTETAAGLITGSGLRLGLQMMIGLPGDTPEKSVMTARKIVALGAADVRIYPTLVIKGTPLEKRFNEGKYKPLTMDEAVETTAATVKIFEAHRVKVIRTGLHPSEDLLHGDALVAGPFHVSFSELVNTFLWKERLSTLCQKPDKNKRLVIVVPEKELNHATGHKASNRKMLEKCFAQVKFKTDASLKNRDFYVDHSR